MFNLRTGSRDLIRDINRNLVLNLIRSGGPISRTDIAERTHLSMATVSGITGALLEAGLVRETGAGESSGGRRPVLLQFEPRAGFVVGLKLTEHAIISAITDLDANVLHHRLNPVDTGQGVEATFAAIAAAVEATIRASAVDPARVLGTGIGLAGVIDSEAGICRYSPILGWRNVAVAGPLEARLGMAVYLDNDVNTLTIAEQWFGYGHAVDHFAVVTVGRGIGAGIVVNGQCYRGAQGGAGELGHLTIDPAGPHCACGKRGCVETLASDPAVLRAYAEALAREGRPCPDPAHLTIDAVAEAAGQGDEAARTVLARAGEALGLGIAHLVNILNPVLVIVGGEGVVAGDWRFGPMRCALEAHTFRGLAGQLRIVIELSGDEAWARGAASLVLGEVFKPPIYRAGEPTAAARALLG